LRSTDGTSELDGGNFTGNIWKYIRLLILEPRLCTQGNAVGIWESSL